MPPSAFKYGSRSMLDPGFEAAGVSFVGVDNDDRRGRRYIVPPPDLTTLKLPYLEYSFSKVETHIYSVS